MGRNGSGKSSLLWALQGSGPAHGGTVDVDGPRPAATLAAATARRLVGLVPQTADRPALPGDRRRRVRAGRPRVGRRRRASPRALLDRLAPGIAGDTHPRDLSEGQRLALVLAVQLAAAPPGRCCSTSRPAGLDYRGQARSRPHRRATSPPTGRGVVVATHDVEFVADVADRVVVMAEGESSPTARPPTCSSRRRRSRPQVAKILAPAAWLTVGAGRRRRRRARRSRA